MYPWMQKIFIPEDLGYINNEGKPLDALDGLKRVNFFVGTTGSGKSRLLRYLASLKKPIVIIGGEVSSQLRPIFREIERNLQSHIQIAKRIDKEWSELKVHGAQIQLERKIKLLLDTFDLVQHSRKSNYQTSSAYEALRTYNTHFRKFIRSEINYSKVEIPQSFIEILDKLDLLCDQFATGPLIEYKFTAYGLKDSSRIFIPSFRFFTNREESEKVNISEIIKNRYFSNLNDDQSSPIVMDSNYLIKQLSDLNNNTEKVIERKSEFEKFLAEYVLFIDDIKVTYDDVNDQMIIERLGAKRPIYEYGDGLFHLIMLVYMSYFGGPRVFFIDEPEIGLHPGLQKAFMQSILPLRTETSQQYFIVTHSNHFLDHAVNHNDVAIFKFREVQHANAKSQFEITKANWGEGSLIQELGISPSSAFLVNSTIWVEGITDRLFLGHLVKLDINERNKNLNKKIYIQEGVHYSFMEYGGANLPHWSFLDSDKPQIDVDTLCGNALLVIDEDSANWKKQRAKKLKKILGDRLIVTKGRELENMVSAKILDQIAKKWDGKGKSNRKDFRNASIGKYMKETYKMDAKIKAKSGTLTSFWKEKFTNEVLTFNDLNLFPSEVRELATKLVNFIIENQ